MNTEKQCPQWALTYALQFFTPLELSTLNCGDYHDTYHSFYVAEAVFEMALQHGRCPKRATFLAQVALLHDADPREPGSAADVRRTLAWMDRNRESLCSRLGWDHMEFGEAQALIARTDFPYGSAPKKSGDIYDGLSPVEVYDLLLGRLPANSLQITMEDAQLLRFADQISNYAHDWSTASLCVDGLVNELTRAGVKTSRYELDTAGFLQALGSDRSQDCLVAWGHAVSPEFYTRGQLVDLLPPHLSENLRRNMMRFRNERYAAA